MTLRLELEMKYLPALTKLLIFFQNVVNNTTQILRTVKSVENENLKASTAINSALESIGQDLQAFYSDASQAEQFNTRDLLQVYNQISEVTAKVVSASNSRKQDDIVDVSNLSRSVVSRLLKTTKVFQYGYQGFK